MMHPEIKKFWGNRLNKISGRIYSAPDQDVTTWFEKDSIIGVKGFAAYEFETETKYYYNGQQYSEDEILRIIKLKAFL